MVIHTIIAVAIQVALWIIFGDALVGAAAGSFLFIGREHAQAEQRWISKFGERKRANMPWYGGFELRAWNKKSLTDWLVPAAVVWFIYIASVIWF